MARVGLTTARLVEAGGALADEIGFQAVTLAELARRFDVKLASLYSHVKNSDHLQQEISLLSLGKLADQSEKALAGRSGKDALIALATVHRAFAREHPGMFEATRYRVTGPLSEEHGAMRMGQLMRAALRGYGLGEADCTHAVRLLASVLLGFSMLEMSGGFDHHRPGPDVSWQRSIDALDVVLTSWK